MSVKNEAARVAVAGEFSIFTAAAVRERLLEALGAEEGLEVDLAGVTEMDSAGVQIMVATKREAEARGVLVRFTGDNPAVLDVLGLCDLTSLMAPVTPAEETR